MCLLPGCAGDSHGQNATGAHRRVVKTRACERREANFNTVEVLINALTE
jgi:hypothetical protein